MSVRHGQAGFTLAELLGGLAIAAILLMPLADMLRSATESARSVRSALDLNNDARFALGRISRRASAATAVPVGARLAPAALLAPFAYATEGTDLVETDKRVTPARKSVIAANVKDFRLTAPEVVDGLPLLTVEITLGADVNAITRTRTIRIGAQP
ncbi:MAG TPA: prepilin-type N-terminal cleavage/methylation domain-containing protein [Pseudoduganella sp.]|jgi:Tfp pilus assembly protein FimT